MLNKNSKNHIDTSQSPTENDANSSFENRCGLLTWRPDCLQKFRNIYLFLTTMCIVCIIQTATSAGYMSSQITTLERRFSLDSHMLGLIQSFFEVGFILSVIFVGYFCGHGRIPLWIGLGMLIISTGAFTFTLPQFITNYSSIFPSGVRDSEMCMTNNSIANVIRCTSDKNVNGLVKLFFIVGQILIGCGSSPILSLAPTYIDDHVPGTMASPLIALLYASAALGPVIGFGLGAVMLKYPENGEPFKGSKPGDYNWIGAWWAGYVCLGILAAFIATFLFFFPRRVRKLTNPKIKAFFKLSNKAKNNVRLKEKIPQTTEPLMNYQIKHNHEVLELPNELSQGTTEPRVPLRQDKEAKKYGKSIKDMPRAILSLIKNKIYVVVTLTICFEMFLVNGFAGFLPKFFENEYKVSNINASLITGGLVVPAGALGIITGGLFMHRFQMSMRKAVLFSISCVLLVLVCMVLFFILSCKSPPFAGINTAIYYNDSQAIMNISNTCNTGVCSNKCDPNQFAPLCDVKSGVTFFSACYAGCSNFTLDASDKILKRPKLFGNCICTSVSENTTGSSVISVGECPLKCNFLITFIILLTIAIFLTGITQNPLMMVTIRSVAKHERSFALGFQFVILRILAFIPSPIVYGSVIDAACVHWKLVCGERGDCLVMDLKRLNYYIIGLSFAVKCGAAIFYILLYFIVPKHAHIGVDEDSRSAVNVIIADN